MTHFGAKKPRWRIRLLPVVIVGVTVLLAVRLGELSFGLELSPTSPALAAEEKADDKGHAEPEPDKAKASMTAPAGDKAHSEREEERRTTDFPVEFTPAEVAVLQDLASRRDELATLETELRARVGLLSAAEGRLDKRIGELQLLRDSIEALVRHGKTMDGLHAGDELIHLEGLGQVFLCPGLQTLDDVVGAGTGRQHDDGNMRRLFRGLNPLRRRHAVRCSR